MTDAPLDQAGSGADCNGGWLLRLPASLATLPFAQLAGAASMGASYPRKAKEWPWCRRTQSEMKRKKEEAKDSSPPPGQRRWPAGGEGKGRAGGGGEGCPQFEGQP